MKKSLLILGALAAMSMIFMGCPNSSTSDPTTGESYTTVTATSGYAGPAWNVESDWETFTIEFAAVPSKMQFCNTSDVVESVEEWGNKYYSTYSGEITTTTASVDLAAQLAALQATESSITKIVSVTLQDMGAGDGVAKGKKVYATKTDGTTTELSIPQASWGYTLSSN